MGSLEVTRTGELQECHRSFPGGKLHTDNTALLGSNIFLAENSIKIAFNNQFQRENFFSQKAAPKNRSLQKKTHSIVISTNDQRIDFTVLR